MKHIYLLSFLLTILIQVHAQSSYVSTHYTTEDGLAQKTVAGIIQDHKGMLWFATWDGLSRFDGYSFKNYKASPGDLIGLANNRIDQLAEDKWGYIWVLAYDRQVFRFNPRTETYEPVPVNGYQANSITVLPSGNVWILTDYEGVIHIHTDENSHAMKAAVYSRNNELLSETIYQIREDREGNQWILTGNGIYRLPPAGNTLTSYFTEPFHAENEKRQSFHFFMENEDELLFASSNGRIWKYNKENERFSLLQLESNATITSIHQLGGERLFFGSATDGFFIFDNQTLQTKHYNRHTLPELNSNHILQVYIDKQGEAWIQTEQKGLHHFIPATGQLTHYMAKDKNGNLLDTQSKFFLFEDIYDRLWLYPVSGNLNFYNRQTGQMESFYKETSYPASESPNRLTTAYSDKQGNLWVCCFNSGLQKVTFNENNFDLLIPDHTSHDPLVNDVRAIFQDKDSFIWVGTKDRLIRIYDKEFCFTGYLTATGEVSPTKKAALGMAYSFIQDQQGTVWIGTKGDGVFSARPRQNQLSFELAQYKHIPNDIYSLSHNDVHCLFEDKQARIWVGTYGGGLNYIDTDTKEKIRFINHRNQLKNYPVSDCYRIRCITSGPGNSVWIGTTNGLLVINETDAAPETLAFHHITRIPGDITSLSNNNVHDILFTSGNELYIAAFGGGLSKLVTWHNGQATFSNYTTAHGFPSDILNSIQEDHHGNIWIAMEEELCRFTPVTDKIEYYTSKDFPVKIKFNEGRAIRSRNGMLSFNTNHGSLNFHPDSIRKSHYTPHLVFTELQLRDELITPNDESHILVATPDDTDKIVLPHYKNSFSIHYAALDMRYPDDIQYAYQLQGFEEKWNYVGKQRIATFTNVPKGKYTLLVRSTNSDRIWVENTRTIPIEILPSFWETPWAYLLYILLLFSFIFIAVFILFTIYRLKNKVSVEQQISDIKLRFFTNISHELRTPLTLIAGPVEYLLEQDNLPDEATQQLKLVEKNISRMLRLVNQILDFRKIQNKKMKLHVRQLELTSFTRHIMGNFQSLADEQNINFILKTSQPTVPVWADADKLEKILFNLLSNAFKYTPQGKMIRITIREEQEEVMIVIADQGIGIEKSNQSRLFERFESLVDQNLFNQPSSGIGLSLVKELVEMHQGKISFESTPGKGTSFTVSLCKGKDHFPENTEFILTDDITIEETDTVRELYRPEYQGEIPGEPQTETLLIVEDNEELRFFLKSIFHTHFNILEAEDGKSGLELARKHMPEIIISDIMMAEMDGIEMIKELRSEIATSHIPVILLTAKSTTESKLEGMQYGADDYITKPFSASYLKARIYNLLEQRKKLQAYYCATVLPSQAEDEQTADPLAALSAFDRKFMEDVLEALNKHMDNGELSVEELAQEVHMSRSVFFKKMKAITGLSPIEFIREVRIKRAAQLIESGGYNMSQVAYMTGFNDPHYFSKSFKRFYGMTPTEYKEKLRE